MTMKKRLLSILLMCCMVLTLLPTTAFAEESTETPPVCSCETACTAESRNAECPVCGAEDALPEDCAKCDQPEAALTELIGGNATERNVSSESELTAAIDDSTVSTVKLATDISISSFLTVKRTVTLDLNGHVLKYDSAKNGSVIVVDGGVNLTLTDSDDKKVHKFDKSVIPWALAADDAAGENIVDVPGGVITGGTGYLIQYGYGEYVYDAYYGGGVYIAPGGQLTMTGGNIIGCSAEYGGGVHIARGGQLTMTGGNIIGCFAECGGGV